MVTLPDGQQINRDILLAQRLLFAEWFDWIRRYNKYFENPKEITEEVFQQNLYSLIEFVRSAEEIYGELPSI